MILLDFSQIIIAQATDYARKTEELVTLELLRHMTLNSILFNKEKFTIYADTVVICIDSKDSWRADIFPYYKKHRIKNKKESSFDWENFYVSMDILIDEFREVLPYKILKIDKCEADDIIATLALRYGNSTPTVIISSDHDFLQLQDSCNKIKQYSPNHKKFLVPGEYSLFEHVVKGDTGDGVPNILSDDDSIFTEGKRQKPVYQAKVEVWKTFGLDHPEHFCTSELELQRFYRNMSLVNLHLVPEHLRTQIVDAYENYSINKTKLFGYLVKHRLKKIMERGNF